MARSLCAVSRRPRDSTARRADKTAGAVISAIGRAPKIGLAKLKSHSSLPIVRSALASRRFLSSSPAAMTSKVLADAAALAALVSFLASEGSYPAAGSFLASSRASRRPVAG